MINQKLPSNFCADTGYSIHTQAIAMHLLSLFFEKTVYLLIIIIKSAYTLTIHKSQVNN